MAETTGTSDIAGSTLIARVANLATQNITVVKAFQGNVYGVILFGTAALAANTGFLKFYDKATAPVPGTDPVLFTVPVVSTTSLAGFVQVAIDEGIPFKNGISYCLVSTVADGTNTAMASADLIHGTILYK